MTIKIDSILHKILTTTEGAQAFVINTVESFESDHIDVIQLPSSDLIIFTETLSNSDRPVDSASYSLIHLSKASFDDYLKLQQTVIEHDLRIASKSSKSLPLTSVFPDNTYHRIDDTIVEALNYDSPVKLKFGVSQTPEYIEIELNLNMIGYIFDKKIEAKILSQNDLASEDIILADSENPFHDVDLDYFNKILSESTLSALKEIELDASSTHSPS